MNAKDMQPRPVILNDQLWLVARDKDGLINPLASPINMPADWRKALSDAALTSPPREKHNA